MDKGKLRTSHEEQLRKTFAHQKFKKKETNGSLTVELRIYGNVG